jgi:phytoene synthase
MSIETALRACEETVRRVDPDRYIAALFAPVERRPLLFALYAFNHELARIGETVKEPMLGDVRLEWWREAAEEARDGHPRAHDVVRALAEVFARSGPPLELFEAMIAARRLDVSPAAALSGLGELEAYADSTSGNLMRLAASVLDEHPPNDALMRHAGTAYALTGILRASHAHAARGKVPLTDRVQAAQSEMLASALAHYAAAHLAPKPGPALAAVLPAALVPLYAKHLARADPRREILLYRRQWTMLRAAMRGRV